MQEAGINAVLSYLRSEFHGTSVERSLEARQRRKSKTEFDYIATMFRLVDAGHVLYVSDLLLEDFPPDEVLNALRQLRVAEELKQVGHLPLLVTTGYVLLLLDWQGPHELRADAIRKHAPEEGGVYILAEPVEAGQWKPYFVDSSEDLSREVQVFSRRGDLGRVRGFFCAAMEAGNAADDEIVRERVTTFLAEACKIDDPTGSNLQPLAVNMPPQFVA